MNPYRHTLQSEIEQYRKQIVMHPVYHQIEDLDDLHVFMKYHVYAVWDFMSLLKALQQHLTCTTTPWMPKGNADTRFLINEIVLGEESDVDAQGNRISHFELYLNAMQQAGASTEPIQAFLQLLQSGDSIEEALVLARVPSAAASFITFTFSLIDAGKPHALAAAFTFGREDLIPDMFHSMVHDLDQRFPDSISTFRYYLERHIEVDGDHHSHLALDMTAQLCGDDPQKWKEATDVSIASLQKRIELWDAVFAEIRENKSVLD
ncbi:MAG: DUF3050 domain-containing protein [Ferruginibacter sp.]